MLSIPVDDALKEPAAVSSSPRTPGRGLRSLDANTPTSGSQRSGGFKEGLGGAGKKLAALAEAVL